MEADRTINKKQNAFLNIQKAFFNHMMDMQEEKELDNNAKQEEAKDTILYNSLANVMNEC